MNRVKFFLENMPRDGFSKIVVKQNYLYEMVDNRGVAHTLGRMWLFNGGRSTRC